MQAVLERSRAAPSRPLAIPEHLDEKLVKEELKKTLQLSAEIFKTRLETRTYCRPAPPVPRLTDWVSISTFLRPLPYTEISVRNLSVFDDGKSRSGSTFTVRPLELDDDGKLGDLEVPPGKTFVLKSVSLTAEDLEQPEGIKNISTETGEKLKQLCMEINALTHPPLAAHPNIIKLLGLTQISHSKVKIPGLILERAEFGTLQDFVSSPAFEPENESQQNQICADIADGLSAIHSSEIIHGDLKPENILVCRDEKHGFIAKIGDLGYSVVLVEGHPEKNFGTDRWAAPELFGRELQMSKASDVYSFGLVCWYVFIGGHDPFDGMDDEDVCMMKLIDSFDGMDEEDVCMMKRVGNGVFENAFKACRDPIRRSILDVCLPHNPDHRSCEIVYKESIRLEKRHDIEQQFYEEYLTRSKYEVSPRKEACQFVVSLCLWSGFGVRINKKKAAEECLEAAKAGSEEARAVVKLMHDICKSSLDEETLVKWLEDILSTSLDSGVRTLAMESLRTIEGLSVDDVVNRSRRSQLRKSTIYERAISQGIYEEENLGKAFQKLMCLSYGDDQEPLSEEEGTTLLAYYTLMGDEEMCRKLVDQYAIEVDGTFVTWALISFNTDLVKMYLDDYDVQFPDRVFILQVLSELCDPGTDEIESARVIRHLVKSRTKDSNLILEQPLFNHSPQVQALRQWSEFPEYCPIKTAIIRNNRTVIEALLSGAVVGNDSASSVAIVFHRSDVLEWLQERNLLVASAESLVLLAKTPASFLQLLHGRKWQENCLKCAKILLKLGQSPFDSSGFAVVIASACGNVPLLQLFLEQDLPEKIRFQEIFEASVAGSVRNNKFGTFRFLLKSQPRYCFADKEMLCNSIIAAFGCSNPLAYIKEMVEQGIADTKTVYERGPEWKPFDRGTLLFWAARSTRPEAADTIPYLIEKGADPNWFEGLCSPLAHAILNPQVLTELIKGGTQIINTAWTLSTVLHECAYLENEPYLLALETIMKTVGEHKIKLDIDTRHPICGSTPLHYAVQAGNRRAVEICLEAGADVLATNGAGFSPIDVAYLMAVKGSLDGSLRGHLSQIGLGPKDSRFSILAPVLVKSYAERKYIIELLHDRCDDPAGLEAACEKAKFNYMSLDLSPDEVRTVITTVQAFTLNLINDFVEGKHDTPAAGLDGYNYLHLFTKMGNVQAVKWFVSEKWNLEIQTDNGDTSLHLACEDGRLDIVKTLLDAGADIMAQNTSGSTPLHVASINGHLQVVETLLGHTSTLECRDIHGRTALHAASRNGHQGVVRALLDATADVNATSKRGWTGLHGAARNGHEEVVKVLLYAKADVNVQTKDGWTSLQLSAWHGHAAVLNEFASFIGILPSTKEGLNVLEHVATTYPNDSLLRRAVGNDCIRRGMISDAKRNFDASVHILLKKSDGIQLENLEIKGVFCDRCRNQIVGRHYKCLECHWNRDICASCLERRYHKHRKDELLEIPTPPFMTDRTRVEGSEDARWKVGSRRAFIIRN